MFLVDFLFDAFLKPHQKELTHTQCGLSSPGSLSSVKASSPSRELDTCTPKELDLCTTVIISQFMHAQIFSLKFNFVPRTVKDWNSSPRSAVEIVEDAKFRNYLVSMIL